MLRTWTPGKVDQPVHAAAAAPTPAPTAPTAPARARARLSSLGGLVTETREPVSVASTTKATKVPPSFGGIIGTAAYSVLRSACATCRGCLRMSWQTKEPVLFPPSLSLIQELGLGLHHLII